MLIGGIQKTTLLDYPEKVACVVFTVGCNFRCGFCHNPELVIGNSSGTISEQEFFDFLESRKKIIDGVVITGGEPLLQKDIKGFIKKIKNKGFLVKLDTNGTSPEQLKDFLDEKLVDYVAMDLKTLPEKYQEVVGVEIDSEKIFTSIKLLLDSTIDYEFRTTVVEGLHTKEDLIAMAQKIKGAKKYYLQKFRSSEKLLDKSFIDKKSLKHNELEEVVEACKKHVEVCEIR